MTRIGTSDLDVFPLSLGGNAAGIGARRFAGQLVRHEREQGRSDCDQDVRPQAGTLLSKLAFEAEHRAEKCCREQSLNQLSIR